MEITQRADLIIQPVGASNDDLIPAVKEFNSLKKAGIPKKKLLFVLTRLSTPKEAEAIKEKIKAKLSEMGLRLSEEKTTITHWSHTVRFLGYEMQGKLRDKGNGIRAVLKIPFEKLQEVKKAIQDVCSYYHIPEVDVMTQVSAIFRGWCNYYRYANDFGILIWPLSAT